MTNKVVVFVVDGGGQGNIEMNESGRRRGVKTRLSVHPFWRTSRRLSWWH